MNIHVEGAGLRAVVEVRQGPEGLDLAVNGRRFPVNVAATPSGDLLHLLVGTRSVTVAVRFEDGEEVLTFHDRVIRLRVEDELMRAARELVLGKRSTAGPMALRSVMPGIVREVNVVAGQSVEAGESLLILEAMKMENEVSAPQPGIVEHVHVRAGQTVERGARLVDLQPRMLA